MTTIVFFGSNQYSVIILQKLLSIPDFNVISVVTKPDAPVGRDQKITANPVSKFARENSLFLLQPLDFDSNFTKTFAELNPDLALCVAYGPPFFTKEMIDIPKYKIVNLHPSPLPRYRGAAPGPWQIAKGETKSSMTFFQIDELPDHGPIIAQIEFPILPTDTSSDFYERAFSIGSENIETILKKYMEAPENITPQDHSKKTYFPKMNKDIAKIDWTQTPEYLERFIRAMQPWPIAWADVIDKDANKKRAQILTSRLENGKLCIDQVKVEGKTSTNWEKIKSYYKLF